MRRIMALLLLLPLPAHAGDALLRDLLTRIDYLQIEDSHRTSYVWDGRFNAINGDAHNVAHFYRAKGPQFNMRTAVKLHETPRLRLTLPLQIDHGYKADLYRARPYLGLGLVAQWAASERLVLGLHLHDALQIGGEVRESPCHDSFRRQFHCGTGLPWSDAGPHLRQNNVATFGQLSVNWRF
jgi:hypothetical protein